MLYATRYTVGIDEVGRGPLAGPVVVCALYISSGKSGELLRGIRDSKQLTQIQRERWFEKLTVARKEGSVDWSISSVTPRVIDRTGIRNSVLAAAARCLDKLDIEPNNIRVLLDGGIIAPKKWIYQETIVRGDEQESVIAAASVVAKVTRDKRMRKYAKRFPLYGLEKHKGYGTEAHYKALQTHGPCELHRKSFLRDLPAH